MGPTSMISSLPFRCIQVFPLPTPANTLFTSQRDEMKITIPPNNALSASTMSEAKPLHLPFSAFSLKFHLDAMQTTLTSNNNSITSFKHDHHVNISTSSNSHSDILAGGVPVQPICSFPPTLGGESHDHLYSGLRILGPTGNGVPNRGFQSYGPNV
ncbi:hypothetical protein FXO38_18877 [Capsicum annuum]|nr:hypothetical protein FXO38_18877 [Capsicum annuum]